MRRQGLSLPVLLARRFSFSAGLQGFFFSEGVDCRLRFLLLVLEHSWSAVWWCVLVLSLVVIFRVRLGRGVSGVRVSARPV